VRRLLIWGFVVKISEQPQPIENGEESPPMPARKRRSRWRVAGTVLLSFVALLIAARLALPSFVKWYVNRTIDQSPLYDGQIGGVAIHLWRGAYSIDDIQIIKTTGNVPVPLFAAKRVDLQLQWDALATRRLVGRIVMHSPQLNFVGADEESTSQSGAGGPWLQIIQDLFPFKINSCLLRDGSIHFRAFDSDPPVDIYLSQLEGSIENLTNIYDEITPLVATVKARARAMDQADFEYEMKFDPFSYYPTFQIAVRLLGLDVTKTNALARAYGGFDFERGFFDLVVELDAKEGQLRGYVKPLFRQLRVFSLKKDVPEDDPLRVFWEALVGATTALLKNPPRDQFGTVISLRGDLTNPRTSLLEILGNVLRNAFVRAYLPRLQGVAQDIGVLEFEPGSVGEPGYVGDQ
jgi:hypothetical protein